MYKYLWGLAGNFHFAIIHCEWTPKPESYGKMVNSDEFHHADNSAPQIIRTVCDGDKLSVVDCISRVDLDNATAIEDCKS